MWWLNCLSEMYKSSVFSLDLFMIHSCPVIFFLFVLFLILFPTISHSFWDFPGGPVDNAPPSNTGNTIPGCGAKIPLVSGPKNQSVIQKQYCNKFKKDFKKNGPHQKILRKKKNPQHHSFSFLKSR